MPGRSSDYVEGYMTGMSSRKESLSISDRERVILNSMKRDNPDSLFSKGFQDGFSGAVDYSKDLDYFSGFRKGLVDQGGKLLPFGPVEVK